MDGTQQSNGLLGTVPGLQPSSTPLAQLLTVLSQIPRGGAQQGNPSAQTGLQAPNAGSALNALNQNPPAALMSNPLGALQQVGNLQQLPWLSAGQNAASMGNSLMQAGNTGTNAGTALSMLGGLF